MSSIILIPDELKTGLTTIKSNGDAHYTFTLSDDERNIVNNLYKGKDTQAIQMQIQFLQSSNQLWRSDSYIELMWIYNDVEYNSMIEISGTYYSMQQFAAAIIPEFTVGGRFTLVNNQEILQDRGLWNLELTAISPGVSDIRVYYNGYQLNQMLGTTHSTDSELEMWHFENVVNEIETSVRRFYMPVVRMMNMCTSLQSKTNVYYFKGKLYYLFARVISSIQAGDYASTQGNIQIPQIQRDQLFQFTIDIRDENFHMCKFLDQLSLCLTWSDVAGEDEVAKILTNRTV